MATPRKLNCNPQKSHFCIGKTGRGSCIANSKACRVSLKPGIETTIAAGTVGTPLIAAGVSGGRERRDEWMKTLPSSTAELKKFLGGDFTVSSKRNSPGEIEVVVRPSVSAVKRYGDSAYRNFSHVGYGSSYQSATAKILEKFYPHLQSEWESREESKKSSVS